MIPFHRPFISIDALSMMEEALTSPQLAGNGLFMRQCEAYFEERYDLRKCYLTNSCTTALEMAALLLDVGPGDEVIIPSYTFVSSANPFVLRGATVVFADSETATPNIDLNHVETLITEKTKAILVMHYGGIACDMDRVMALADQHGIFVVEDAAHSQGAFWKDQVLGGIGHLGTYSFHATKNTTCGQGGLLMVNDPRFIERAEIIMEKGTNRSEFLKGTVDRYEWMDVGSSPYPSEITAAFLWAQLQYAEEVQSELLKRWNYYFEAFSGVSGVQLPSISEHTRHNAHTFFLKLSNQEQRDRIIEELKAHQISASFHYLALHRSPFMLKKNQVSLRNAEEWEDQIVRLPLYYDLPQEDQDTVISLIKNTLN